MKVAGALAIVGIGLLVVPFLYGGALPPVLGLIFLAVTLVWRLVAGPNGIWFAMLLGLASLATFGYAILSLHPMYFSSWVWIAISAALFILAITEGVAAFMDKWATRNGRADQQQVTSPN